MVGIPKRQIGSLQVFRGIASIAVVCHHAALYTEAFVGTLPPALLRVTTLGALGVDFFFVLSGFIIMHSHLHEANSTTALWSYSFKRLLRIFPVYWPIGLGMLGAYALMPHLSASGGREYSYLSSVVLVPASLPPALSVAWTLVHELLFYGFFMLWFISARAFVVAGVLWVGLTLLVAITGYTNASAALLRYPLSPLNVEFFLGVIAALLNSHWKTARVFYLLSSGIGIAIWGLLRLYDTPYIFYDRAILAIGLMLIILGVAKLEATEAVAWPPFLLLLGNASFSIYLAHNPFLSISQRALGGLGVWWGAALFCGTITSIGIGYLYFVTVETPVRRYSQAIQRGSKRLPGIVV